MIRVTFVAFATLLAFSVLTALTATPARAACSSPAGTAGTILFNSAQAVMQYCDNTNWIAMCAAPRLAAAALILRGNPGTPVYNTDYKVPRVRIPKAIMGSIPTCR